MKIWHFRHFNPALLKRIDDTFGWNISDERVLREWTATQAPDRRIKSPATGVVSSQYFFYRMFAGAVQVHPDFGTMAVPDDRADRSSNQLRIG
jgi:hypothetical protein